VTDRHDSSFRDPSGYLFKREGTLYRSVNDRYRSHYDLLMSSGLYDELTSAGLLIPHQEETLAEPPSADAPYKILRPELVEFISYPYEWSFSQLKDAALATLAIQRRALAHGMTLKDASAYNIQFQHGSPVLIDTLSFEAYEPGAPWVAYRQFCQHFVAPLALMAYRDVRLSGLMRLHIDGVPLDLATGILPRRTRLRPSLAMHLHLHAWAQSRYASSTGGKAARPRKVNLQAMTSNLEGLVRRLSWKPAGTEWGDYYTFTNYDDAAFGEKRAEIEAFVDAVKPGSVWDLGGNTGFFSRITSDRGIPTVSFDIDPAAVEKNYLETKRLQERMLLPLVQDLTNPSPALGWALSERESLLQRGPVDLVLFLAMIHHMAIGNNVPFDRVAEFLSKCCRHLAIEWVPKGDSQVERMLSSREDVFDDYNQDAFERAFSQLFTILKKSDIPGTNRTLYLMKLK
jgi:hypothetical protein